MGQYRQLTSLIDYGTMRTMKLKKYYLLSIIVLLMNGMFFDISSPSFIDNTLETKVEVALEEKKSGDKFIASTSEPYVKNEKEFTSFYFSIFRVNHQYLNNIFKPPISLHS